MYANLRFNSYRTKNGVTLNRIVHAKNFAKMNVKTAMNHLDRIIAHFTWASFELLNLWNPLAIQLLMLFMCMTSRRYNGESFWKIGMSCLVFAAMQRIYWNRLDKYSKASLSLWCQQQLSNRTNKPNNIQCRTGYWISIDSFYMK